MYTRIIHFVILFHARKLYIKAYKWNFSYFQNHCIWIIADLFICVQNERGHVGPLLRGLLNKQCLLRWGVGNGYGYTVFCKPSTLWPWQWMGASWLPVIGGERKSFTPNLSQMASWHCRAHVACPIKNGGPFQIIREKIGFLSLKSVAYYVKDCVCRPCSIICGKSAICFQ